MANVFNDGDIPYGSQVLTINGTSYVAEDINFEEGIKTIDREDELGNPNGAVYIAQKITGTMVLQLSSISTPIPERNVVANGLTFRGAAKDFIITKVSQPQKQADIHKIHVEVAERLNA